MEKKIIEVEWNGFIAKAMNTYPKEACGFLFSKRPYTDEEYWVVIPLRNVAKNPEDEWIPDRSDVKKARERAKIDGLVKIGNIHSHPFPEDSERTEENFKELVQPSELDLKFAKKYGDIVRIIFLVDDKKVLAIHVHDQYGKSIPCILNQRKSI